MRVYQFRHVGNEDHDYRVSKVYVNGLGGIYLFNTCLILG